MRDWAKLVMLSKTHTGKKGASRTTAARPGPHGEEWCLLQHEGQNNEIPPCGTFKQTTTALIETIFK